MLATFLVITLSDVTH